MKKRIYFILGGWGGVFLLISSLYAFYIGEETGNNSFLIPPSPPSEQTPLNPDFLNSLMNENNNFFPHNELNPFFNNPKPELNLPLLSPLNSGLSGTLKLNFKGENSYYSYYKNDSNKWELPNLENNFPRINLNPVRELNSLYLSLPASLKLTFNNGEQNPQEEIFLVSLFSVRVDEEKDYEGYGEDKEEKEAELFPSEQEREERISGVSAEKEDNFLQKIPQTPSLVKEDSSLNYSAELNENNLQIPTEIKQELIRQDQASAQNKQEEEKPAQEEERKIEIFSPPPKPEELQKVSPFPKQPGEQEDYIPPPEPEKENKEEAQINEKNFKEEIDAAKISALREVLYKERRGGEKIERKGMNLNKEEVFNQFVDSLKENLDKLVEKCKSPFSLTMEGEFRLNFLRLPPKKEDK
ncbi:MAG: hypothetical protein NC898_05860 [Candidatus Omnitrophica bacterium]|nr:hypothetical protein [Candidatus Omnitrophota bacterium]